MIASVKYKKNAVTLVVSSVSAENSYTVISFSSATQSIPVFRLLKKMGVDCHHAGNNAPCGPSVIINDQNVTVTVK